ncbi:endo alpha-1,4 polygalactosaminidase [Microbacterium helvum]|uniref:endo alpha-1,4 polygalactosaminidase n=1 Tax=Microbacterium helvum TaxID=2773713 RepID=UPI002963CD6E|nr:endo alpha-1,4 polygalactosaminidase [Microbacterium helvum]
MIVSRQTRRPALIVAVIALSAILAGCAAEVPTAPTDDTTPTPAARIALPPAGAVPDYQLGAAYDPPAGVQVVARDRTAEPAPDVYSICYVNGFQTQPGELGDWPEEAVLTDPDGDVVFDPDWPDEALLDTSSAAKRARIADVVTPWIRGCADVGFDAVEFDNLDTYERSGGALTLDHNLALATLLVDAAHGVGLAAGQKNAAEDAAVLHATAGFDFAVAEECAVYDECALYTEVYGDHVIAVEYSDTSLDFAAACADPAAPASLVLRDRDLVGPDDDAYVFALCGDAMPRAQ